MENKFKLICLECGSERVTVEEDIDYDYEETPYVSGYYLQCHDCANNSKY